MMKNWKKLGIGALCAAMLLTGCGVDNADPTPPEEPDGTKTEELSPDTLRAVNDPQTLLEKHDTVTVSIQGSDGEGNETYTAKFQYARAADGTVLAWSHHQYTENSGVGEDELWGEGSGGAYASRMASDSTAYLNLYPAGEYERYILDMIPQCPAPGENEETIDERSEQDGALLLSVTTRYPGFDDYYYTTLYYVDPASNELLAMSVTDYSRSEDGTVSELGTTLYNWSYDEPYRNERGLLSEVVFAADSAEDTCALTYFYPAQGAEDGWDVSEIRVARGTYVTFCCSTGCMLYADKELTQPIDDTQGVDTSGGSAAVYIVPDAPAA